MNGFHHWVNLGSRVNFALMQLISATDRHRHATEHPIKFSSRRPPNSVKFKIKPGTCLWQFYLLDLIQQPRTAENFNYLKWSRVPLSDSELLTGCFLLISFLVSLRKCKRDFSRTKTARAFMKIQLLASSLKPQLDKE